MKRPRQPQLPRSPLVQPKRAPMVSITKQPVAPPVYRPQPVPKVLQTKKLTAPQPITATRQTPAPPPVYHPQPVPKALQRKSSTGKQSAPDKSAVLSAGRPDTKKVAQLRAGVTPPPSKHSNVPVNRGKRPAPFPTNSTIQRKPQGVSGTNKHEDPELPGLTLSLMATEANGRLEIYKIEPKGPWFNYQLGSGKYYTSDKGPAKQLFPAGSRVNKLNDLVEELPTEKSLASDFEVLKSRAGLNQQKTEKQKKAYAEVKEALPAFIEKVGKARTALLGYIKKTETNLLLVDQEVKALDKDIANIEKQIASLLTDAANFSDILIEMSPKPQEPTEENKKKPKYWGTYGVITEQAVASIPAPYNQARLLIEYLSTMARPHGQPGIHIRTNGEVVLKFLGVLGNYGILSKEKDKGGKYIFHEKLARRH